MEKSEILINWINSKKELAKQKNEEFFMGIPDSWFIAVQWCCINGHVLHMFLKSENHGSRCLACGETVFIYPKNATLEEYEKVLEIL